VRAVLDPNVIVSALLSRGGTPAKLLRSWLDGDYELVVSPSLLAELERVLSYPKITRLVTPDETQELLNLLRQQADLYQDPTRAPMIASPDPNDDYLIALAQTAPAVLVSGDTDLLGLTDQIPVYSPEAFLALLSRL
jgi:putative PIN family toxin of toxin-antitoxin system